MPTLDEQKLLYPRSIVNKVEGLTEDVRSLRSSRPLNVTTLEEITPYAGNMHDATIWVTDPNTLVVRGVLTALPNDATGNYHLAFFNPSSQLTVGVDADTGALLAGLGSVVLDQDGISAIAGEIGGWEIDTDSLSRLVGGIGIVMDSTLATIHLGNYAGDHLVMDGLNQQIRSSNFAAGVAGLLIDTGTGDMEANNVIVRGKISTMVFEKNAVSAIGGYLALLRADILAVDMTAADNSTLTISGLEGLSVNDIILLKDAFNEEWMRVTNIASAPTYVVTRDLEGNYAADANPAWTVGQSVVNYGASGSGAIEMISGVNPQIRIFTHTGSPWTSTYEVARIDKSGIVFGNIADVLSFKNAAGTGIATSLYGEFDDHFLIWVRTIGKAVRFLTKMNDGTNKYTYFGQDNANANVHHFDLSIAAAGAKWSMGNEVIVWSGTGGVETVFNNAARDIDFRIESVLSSDAFKLDASTSRIGINVAIPSVTLDVDGDAAFNKSLQNKDFSVHGLVSKVLWVDASENRTAFGSDHYIPTRNASNTTGYWNEANFDMDFIFEGVLGEVLKIDAGEDAVYYRGAKLREILTANRTYYVATTGNDNNSGLTAGAPFQTIQKAINVVSVIDIGTFTVTIQLADGTYTVGGAVTGPWLGPGTVIIQGNASVTSNVLISVTGGHCFSAADGGRLSVRHLMMQNTTSGMGLAAVTNGSITVTGPVIFGVTPHYHVWAASGGSIFINTNYSITGGALRHWSPDTGGSISCGSRTITLTGTPNFGNGFANASLLGAMIVNGNTFVGAATGQRYIVSINGIIYTASAGANYLPGNVAGTAVTGGQYI